MAKKFKDWDKRFNEAQIEACRRRWLSVNTSQNDNAWFTNALEHMGYTQPSPSEAIFAVYEAEGFEEWQLFRVALKGQSTRQKVAMLRMRWDVQIDCARGDVVIESQRIWNYIGALKRGGQLVNSRAGGMLAINK